MKDGPGTPREELDRPWFAFYDEGVPKHIEYPDAPLQHFLSESARKHPDRDAIIFYGARLTYRALNEAADRFASALSARGLTAGDRVSLFLPNCPQMVIAYYGTLRAGGVAVPTSPLYSARELEHQLNDSGAWGIVTLTKFYPLVKEVAPRKISLPPFAVTSHAAACTVFATRLIWVNIAPLDKPVVPPVYCRRARASALNATSGGLPAAEPINSSNSSVPALGSSSTRCPSFFSLRRVKSNRSSGGKYSLILVTMIRLRPVLGATSLTSG